LVHLQQDYMMVGKVYRFCRKIFALPYLSQDSIVTFFEQLETRADSTPKLVLLMDYIRSTWIDSTIWPPSAWSVYGQPVRTNNDVEGWHYRLKRKAQRSVLNLYLLCRLLYEEAEMVEVNVRLLSDGKVRRMQRSKATKCQSKL